jgi:LytS/YehU family sensor histidine kinase
MEVFHWIFVTYMVVPEEDAAFLQRKLKMIQTIDVTFLIVIYAFMTSFRIFQYLQQKQLELLQWQREYAQTQFETVKNQLNPHFLFNSLNALSSLVYVDAGAAETFIEKLSKSYRYLLEQKDKQTVPLKEELQFLDSFLYLVQQRFGKKLQVQYGNVTAGNYQVAPHSLMIVFDYILATNGMSNAKPLVINIVLQNDTLHITYNRQPKGSTNEQAVEQLKRLQEQYTYITHSPLTVDETPESGAIHLPLLPA